MTGYTRSSSSSKTYTNNVNNKDSVDDANLSSLFHQSTIDITNQLNVMLDNESKIQYQCLDYLYGHTYRGGGSGSSSRGHSSRSYTSSSTSRSTSASTSHNRRHTSKITTSSRSKIVTWLNNCVDYLNISRVCVALAMSYVDRFMSSTLPPSSSAHNGGERETAHINNVKRN